MGLELSKEDPEVKGLDNRGYKLEEYDICNLTDDSHQDTKQKDVPQDIKNTDPYFNTTSFVETDQHCNSYNSLDANNLNNTTLAYPDLKVPPDIYISGGNTVDDMPTKRRSSRGSRRSGNRDDDQGHLLEPGSSREEDDQRHPHAHTNAPATRTESQEKDDAINQQELYLGLQPSSSNFSHALTVGVSPSAEIVDGQICRETGIKISQSSDCAAIRGTLPQNDKGCATRTKTSCSTSALANHTIGADTHSFHSLDHTSATKETKETKETPAAQTSRTKTTATPPSKGAVSSSNNHLETPPTPGDSLKKSASKHSDSQVSRQSASGTADGAASTTSGVSTPSQRTKTPGSGGRGRHGAGGSGGGGATPRQKVVYYQNRFITIPIDPGDRKECAAGVRIGPAAAVPSERDNSGTGTTAARSASGANRGGGGGGGSKHGGRTGTGPQVKNPGGGTEDPDGMDPNIAAMAGLGPQPGAMPQSQVIQVAPETPKRPKKKRKTPKILKKIALCLQDNRMRTGNDETKEKIREMNENQDSTNMILKKILNIIFVTTGVTLFLSVVIVIIYTSIVPAPAGWPPNDPKDNSIDRPSREGKPGSNPGDYELPGQNPTPPSEMNVPSTTPATEDVHLVNRLELEDEDHEVVPTPWVFENPNTRNTEPEIEFRPYFPEDADYNNYGGNYELYDIDDSPMVYPLPTERVRPTPMQTTTPATTTRKPTEDFFEPRQHIFDYYDYGDNLQMNPLFVDANKHHRLYLKKQKLNKEKRKLFKFHRRRHRHHRHRGSN